MKKSIGSVFIALVFLTGLLSACAPATTPVPSTFTPSPIPLTFTPSPIPPTFTPRPTATLYQDPLYVTEVNVTAGTYQDSRYTPSEQNFYCDFGKVLDGTVYPTLQDTKNGENYGAVWSTDGYGQQFGIDYFRYSVLPDKTKALLENPQTRKDGLKTLFKDILLPNQQNNFPGLKIVHQDFVNDETLFTVFDKPHGSNLSVNNVAMDSQVAFYIFVGGEWFYFVSYDHTPTEIAEKFDSDQMQTRLEEFYNACKFKS